MFLTSLSLSNFRLFSRLELELPRKISIIVGENAQGKTSILEAIFFFAALNSLLAQNDRQLIHFSTLKEERPVARLVAGFQRADGGHHMEIRLILEPGANGVGRMRKEILLDGIKRTQSSSSGQFLAVVFLPQMMRILEGSPEERRRFMDGALSQAYRGYAKVFNEYVQVLAQRNALLKQLAERGGDADQLNYWDEALTQHGASIIHTRISALEEINLLATNEYRQLSHQSDHLQIIYQPSCDPLDDADGQKGLKLDFPIDRRQISVDEIKQVFQKKLLQLRREEITRGVTVIGPHRDELRALGNGVDLSAYGSRGQIRSAVLALKLAELKWLKEKRDEWPVLLLDETMAELDVQHRNDLISVLGGCDQAILTTTDLHLFPSDFITKCSVWQVRTGQVTAGLNSA